jgi:putative Mg2+ transporter-C (MgtC) family protein
VTTSYIYWWRSFSRCRSAGIGRGAGLRSLPLVAMAGCGLVQTAILVLRPCARSQANILQGVVIGVGFIGAGALIRQGDITTGNATAANVWVVGIMGAAVGYRYYYIGIISPRPTLPSC